LVNGAEEHGHRRNGQYTASKTGIHKDSPWLLGVIDGRGNDQLRWFVILKKNAFCDSITS
jgi:hypothetical protein